jgi:hypothetical protein
LFLVHVCSLVLFSEKNYCFAEYNVSVFIDCIEPNFALECCLLTPDDFFSSIR